VKRTILILFLLVVSQPLLIGAGVLARWLIDCGSGACAGTVRAYSPFGSPRDVLLTALAAAAPYLLAVLVAAVTWLLAGRTLSQPAAGPVAASSLVQAVDRPAIGNSFPSVGNGRRLDHLVALLNGKSKQSKAYGAANAGLTMPQSELEATR
jgi:hypothetical protein